MKNEKRLTTTNKRKAVTHVFKGQSILQMIKANFNNK
jgi:hypothetical protein